jgi:predicted transcriptional regulator
MNYINDVTSQGLAVLENVVDSETVSVLLREVAKARIDKLESQRAGKAFGIRNLLNVVPFTREASDRVLETTCTTSHLFCK